MDTSRQFRNLSDPTATFEELFHAALESLLPDLADAPWYVRERDVVNLFVFRHLVPAFQAANLDIGQIAIEVPVQVLPQSPEERPGVYADIVVWPHNKATIWRKCKPLARIEWKNISCRVKSARHLEGQHQKDVEHLNNNCQLASVGYALLTLRQGGSVEIRCKRIADEKVSEFLALKCETTNKDGENAISRLKYEEAMSRKQECPMCVFSHEM
jgi:hypothetical protein